MDKKEKIIKSKELVKETWILYKENVIKFVEIFIYGLVGLIPMMLFFGLLTIYLNFFSEKVSLSVNLIVAILSVVAFIVSLYFVILYSVRTKVASLLLIKNGFIDPKKNFEAAKPYFVKFLGVSVLLFVLILAWGFLLVVPAIIFAVYYSFAKYILVFEDKRPFTSIEKSYDLVKGYFWPVFGRLALALLLAATAYTIISIPLSWVEDGGLADIILNLSISIVWAFLSPYFIIYFYKLYRSLKEVNN